MTKTIDLVQSIARGAEPKAATTTTPSEGGTGSDTPATRRGKVFIGGYFAPEVARQVRILAAEQDTTIQTLVGEALNHLFATHNKPEIAPRR
ncbi:MAG: hypothetical protein OXE84_02960 [Rhodobacteraceae bacterium]|nr:hypothetical protein [Paracoccaceae bacterium]MCY4326900.1 hypothetical protein [Paracoccaceae bacterium]